MKQDFPFSKNSSLAFKNDPPGQWLLTLPEGCIRLSSGYPQPLLVPAVGLKTAAVRLLEEEQDLPLQYMGSPRILQLKEFIQKRLAERGVEVAKEGLLVTSGACQGIDLISRILLDDQAVVALESPTYMEALEVFQNYTEHFMAVPVDEQGLDTERFAEMLENCKREGLKLPRILYTIPTSQNPTGTTLTAERRKRLLELAEEFDFLILEDDAYGELGFTQRPRLLKAMDDNNRVLHIGSMSKVVAPGMRIGWVAGPEKLIKVLSWFKKDLNHPFAQSTMASFLESIDFDDHLKLLTDAYQAKSTAMIQALEQFMPPSVTWYVPEGGYFVWVKIPGVDTAEMLPQALDAGVSYVPGKYFFLDQERCEYLRLSFSYADAEAIVKGIQKLAEVVAVNVLEKTGQES
ncbi:aminotransferase-like domain-containing protein [Paenisporosarcina sp. TG-14]|uniref:aminotransferase-like domain-containing protein n=1 Tax=Paenisporosarcina sp. TG-14 TaxID=1231057 RepID=UPI0002E6C1A2|nr:PLP-dependent aminotransferase family protein [Paenisporosarcina sp. TG-14]